jgi:hypothetical protein
MTWVWVDQDVADGWSWATIPTKAVPNIATITHGMMLGFAGGREGSTVGGG